MRSDGQTYLRCDECGEYVNSSESEAHACNTAGSQAADGQEATLQLSQLAVRLLTDSNGISEEAWTVLRPMLLDAGQHDIVTQVDATDGRFYLPESHDKVREVISRERRE